MNLIQRSSYNFWKSQEVVNKKARRILKEKGWTEEAIDKYKYLDEVVKSTYGISIEWPKYEKSHDWCDPLTGETLLPASEVPYGEPSSSFWRPSRKKVWYEGHWFEVGYYHDLTVSEVILLNE